MRNAMLVLLEASIVPMREELRILVVALVECPSREGASVEK